MSRIAYLPFGGTRASSGTIGTDRQYTGQRLDQSGLYFYNARYGACPEASRRDAGIGRFISEDTVVPDFRNPQALNRYSYVVNNPLRYTDPSGHCPWCVVALAAVGAAVKVGFVAWDIYT